MLRLQSSEIAISPEDVRRVNEHLDQRKRARCNVRLRPGPERSRDEAITRLHDTGMLSHRAEVSDQFDVLDHDDIIRAPTRTALVSGQAQLRTSPEIVSSSFRSGSPSPYLTMGARSGSLTSYIRSEPLRAQLDGQSDGLASSGLAGIVGVRSVSSSSLLLQARALSAPSIPQVMVQAPTPHAHVRLPMSDGAIAFAREDSATRRVPVPSMRNVQLTAHRAIVNEPQRIRRVAVGRLRAPGISQIASSPSTVREVSPATLQRRHNGSSSDSSSSPASSSSSSAAEAAVVDRPSPLESISQQAAIAHSRMIPHSRRQVAHRIRLGMLARQHAYMSHSRELSDPVPIEESRAQSESLGLQSMNEYNLDVHHVMIEATQGTIAARRGDTSTPADDERSVDPQSRAEQPLSMRHQPLPIRPYNESQQDRVSTSLGSVERLEAFARHPVPPRHSSRLRTPMVPEPASRVLPRTRPATSVSPPRGQMHRTVQMQPPPPTIVSPRRNGAEIQRATALPIPPLGQQHPDPAARTTAHRQHIHVPYATTRARQRDQENSEEASMSRFEDDVRILREREREREEANHAQDGSNDSGVLNDTPPRALGVERYLNGL